MDKSVYRTGTSRKPFFSSVKPFTPILMITDSRFGHSNMQVDDDDFFDPHLDCRKANATNSLTPHSVGPLSKDVSC